MRPLRDYPMDDADRQALKEYGAARRRGDREAASRALRKFKASPPILVQWKRLFGAAHVRENYNTTLADQELGPDWLDRDDI